MAKYPSKYDLDGIYFRVCRNESWQSVCFSDLTEEEQDSVMVGRDVTWLKSLCKILANQFRQTCEDFGIIKVQ